MKNYLGIDIGGTKCAVVAGDEQGRIIGKHTIPTEAPSVTLKNILTLSKSLMAASGNIVAAGISCGGPLDAEKGIIKSPPNLPGWDDISIVRIIRDELHINAVLENDANACALAEWRFGAGRGTSEMIFLTFGTGMGAGIIINGKILDGANGNAGEIGHIRLTRFGPIGYGKQGSFEGFVSGGGIAMMAKNAVVEQLQRHRVVMDCKTAADIDRLTAKSVAEFAKKGDRTAISIYETCGEMLGRGLAVLIDILNPEMIVIGSIFQRDEALLRGSMEKVLAEECLPSSLNAVKIVPAGLGDDIGNYAALSLVTPEE